MALPDGASHRSGIHATGQPDTPVEVITALLGSALQSDSVDDMKRQLQQAYDVVAGLDPYLESVSTPPSAVHTTISRHWTASLRSMCCPSLDLRSNIAAGLSKFDPAVFEARLGRCL